MVADVRGGQTGAAPAAQATVDLQVRTRAGTWRRATGWTHRTTGRPAREVDLAGVRPGVYRVVVSHPHYLTATTRAFRVRGAGVVRLPRIVLDPGLRLEGTYVADGGWSMEHPPQARAYLRVRTPSGGWRWRMVREEPTVALEDDMTDRFVLRGLEPGTYAVCVRVITLGCLGGPSPAKATKVRLRSGAHVDGLVVRRTTL